LEEGRSFWLYGLKGCGKTHRLERAVEAVSDEQSVQVVTLFPEMTLTQWSEALFDALPASAESPSTQPTSPQPSDVEDRWRRWCELYVQHADAVFVVIDGWQWMPRALLRHGVQMLFHQGASCGFVACATPHTYLWADQILKLDIIKCPLLDEHEEQQMVCTLFAERDCLELYDAYARFARDRTGHPMHQLAVARGLIEEADRGDDFARQVQLGLCRNLLEAFDRECIEALSPLAHLGYPMSPHVLWRYFERDTVLSAIECGALYEDLDTVVVPAALSGALAQTLKPSDDQWWQLLHCMWDTYLAASAHAGDAAVDPALVQALLGVFSKTSQVGEETEEQRAFLVEVMGGIDDEFRTLLAIPRLPAALQALEAIPARLHGAMPAARFRLSQSLSASGRKNEADKLLRGLLRMKNTDVGKRAFLWTQMFAAYEGNADEAVTALMAFLDERVEPGDPLDTVARLVLTRILTFRGFFRQALPIVRGGIRSARGNGAIRDLHLLRNLHGMCLSFTGERETGLPLMHDACDTLQRLDMELAHVEARHILATVYFELEEYEKARVEARTARAEYERLDDQRNLRMLEVKEHLIALSLGEEEPPPWSELDKAPAATEWSYYQAELSFADALHAKRRGDEELTLRNLRSAFQNHLARGNVQALGRLLRHYLPLLLERMAFVQTRELLASLDRHHLQERELGEITTGLIDAVWLTGDFVEWEVTCATLVEGAPQQLFPRSATHSPTTRIAGWADQWEGVVCGEARGFEDFSGLAGSAQLGALHRGWAAIWKGDIAACRRALLLCEEIDLEGTLFGFLRGLLHWSISRTAGGTQAADGLRWRAEILEFWRRLSPQMTVHQLNFWEGLLERKGDQMPEILSHALERWLGTIQQWRIEQAMLIDEELGIVFIGEHRHDLGSDTITFSVLSYLAHHQHDDEPVSVGDLFEDVWERTYNPPSSNSSVYVTIGNLRQELDGDARRESVIRLERGEGYALDIPTVLAPR
jgi:DNA-binding winged helix-turn-helix (wHTH) protein/tetratricopeptide (TPR) repeat protein